MLSSSLRMRFPTRLGVLAALTALLVPLVTSISILSAHATGYDLVVADLPSAPMTASGCTAITTCYNAKLSYGATGSGTSDDQVHIQAAVTAATATGGTVFLDSGVYLLDHTIALPPGVSLAGAGWDQTTLKLDPTVWSNFGYGFLVSPTGSGSGSTTVRDVKVDGSRSSGGYISANQGGGIKVASNWTVTQVRFTNLNYFKLWVYAATSVTVSNNRFDNLSGASGSANDNIGGGTSSYVTIQSNQWDASAVGNSIDLLRSSFLNVSSNTSYANNMYFEGVTDSTVSSNSLTGGGMAMQSNASYNDGNPVINPARDTVSGNTITNSSGVGVSIAYGQNSTAPSIAAGGGNTVSGNTITGSWGPGVIDFGQATALKTSPDSITGNTIVNPMSSGAATFNTGTGTPQGAGIVLIIGNGDTLTGNSVQDTRSPALDRYGVVVGTGSSPAIVQNTVLNTNSQTGTLYGLYGGMLPPAPTTVSATRSLDGSVKLAWSENVNKNDVLTTGYRIYRDGTLIQDLPAGTTADTSNLLPAAQSDLESGLAGWTTLGTNTVSVGSVAIMGTQSLALTNTSAGSASAKANGTVSVTGGALYTVFASFQGTAPRSVRPGIQWYDSTGTRIGGAVAPAQGSFYDATTGWVNTTYTATAPSNATGANVRVFVDGPASGEVHYADRIGIAPGVATETFSDTGAAAGPHTYTITAYNTNLETPQQSAATSSITS